MILKSLMKKLLYKAKYLKSEINLSRSINSLYKNLSVKASDPNLISQHKKYWNQLKRNVNPKWFEVYTKISGNPDIHYVPENIFHNIIEEKLNNKKLAFAYKDKNFYELFYPDTDLFPETLVRNINGFFYDRTYRFITKSEECIYSHLRNRTKIIIKPALESGGGKKVELFSCSGGSFFNGKGERLTLKYLNDRYHDNFIIQNYIHQSSFTSQFNESSVNTFRLFTYRSVSNNDIHVLHVVLRIGRKGNFVDDQNAGGLACRVKGTKLDKYATDIHGNKYDQVNGVHFSHSGEIPNLKEMIEAARMIAGKNIHSRLMGLDFCLDIKNNVKLVEINNQYAGINFFQMNSASVFGNYTDEVVEYCKNNSH